MKAWAKRMLWYAIWQTFSLLDNLVRYVTNWDASKYSDGTLAFVAFIELMVLVVPLLFMEDDK